MIKAFSLNLGKLTLLLATTAFLTAVSLFLLGSYLMTWPILRKSPRNQRIEATINLAQAGMALLTTFQGNTDGE
jgi:hypothetical protein